MAFFLSSYSSQFILTKCHQLGPGACLMKSQKNHTSVSCGKETRGPTPWRMPSSLFSICLRLSFRLFCLNKPLRFHFHQTACPLISPACSLSSSHISQLRSVVLERLYLGLTLPWAHGWDETSEKRSLEGASLTPDWFLSTARWGSAELKHKHFFRWLCVIWERKRGLRVRGRWAGIKNNREKKQRQKLTMFAFSVIRSYILLLFRQCLELCSELRSG